MFSMSCDLLGERWTLLVVRELLYGPKRYTDLVDNLPGIGTNILAARLKDDVIAFSCRVVAAKLVLFVADALVRDALGRVPAAPSRNVSSNH